MTSGYKVPCSEAMSIANNWEIHVCSSNYHKDCTIVLLAPKKCNSFTKSAYGGTAMGTKGWFTALSPQYKMTRPDPAGSNPANSDAAVCHETECLVLTIPIGLQGCGMIDADFGRKSCMVQTINIGTLGSFLNRTPTSLLLLRTTYTCAFKSGCLMSHNWLHTPNCKV